MSESTPLLPKDRQIQGDDSHHDMTLVSGDVEQPHHLVGDDKEEINDNKTKKASFMEATVLLWTDIAGIGSFAIGYYMAHGGVWFTLCAVVFVAWIADRVAQWMHGLAHKYKQGNYIDMCSFALGKPGRVLGCFFVFMYNFGGFCAGLLALGSSFPPLLIALTGHKYWWIDRHYVILFFSVILAPIAFAKNIAHLAWTCFIVIGCFLSVAGLILYQTIDVNVHNDFEGFKELEFIAPGFFSIIGGLCFIFVCHDISFSVALSLQNPTKKRWAWAVHICIGVSLVMATSIGIFAYSVFGKDTKAFVLDNFPATHVLANIARVLIVVFTVMGIPYSFFMPRIALEGIIFAFYDQKKMTPKRSHILHIVLTVFISISSLLIAELLTDLGVALEFLGGCAAAGIAFIMPPSMLLKLNPGRWWHPREKLKYSLALCFGVFCVAITTVTTVQNIMAARG